MDSIPRWATVAEAASQWGVHPATVRWYLRHGRIPGAVRHGRSWAIPRGAKVTEPLRPVGRPKSRAIAS